MITLNFSIQINATPEKVWHSITDPEKYKLWTKPFSEGSYYKTDSFTEGSKIHFLTPEGHGMFSLIDSLKENQFVAFKHLGEIKNFEEIQETQSWTGAMETYILNKTQTGTEVFVKLDTLESDIDSMNKAFPQALQELKHISENQ